jgi:hypothetical protein
VRVRKMRLAWGAKSIDSGRMTAIQEILDRLIRSDWGRIRSQSRSGTEGKPPRWKGLRSAA